MRRGASTQPERGSVLVIVAVSLTAFLLMTMLILDLGDWWVHKRHLQTQADSAALAGGKLLRAGCDSSQIRTTVSSYASATSWPGSAQQQMGQANPALNSQIDAGPGESVAGAFNSDTYPPATNSTDPCQTAVVDVKLADQNVPDLVPLLGIGSLSRITAHARYARQKVGSVSGLVPFGVEDPMPSTVKAVLVDETTGNPITVITPLGPDPSGAILLTNPDAPNAPTYDRGNFTGSGSFRLPAQTGSAAGGDPVGVRINASGTSSVTSSTGCDPAQQCYDTTNASLGLVQLRSWPDATQHPTGGSVAMIHRVQVGGPSGGCAFRGVSTGYFADLLDGACQSTATITADVEFANGVSYPTNSSDTGATTSRVNLSTNGGSTSTPMSYQGGHIWQGTVSIPTESNGGPVNVSLQEVAHSGTISGSDCTKNNLPAACTSGSTYIPVQRTFSATSTRSGLLDKVSVVDTSAVGTDDAYSLQCGSTCPSHNYTISVHFHDGLKADNSAGAAITTVLRSQGNTVSCTGQNSQALASDIKGACGWYRVAAPTESCPDASTAAATQPNPSECADMRNGNSQNSNAIGSALDTRINGGSSGCNAPNNWAQFPNIPTGDPRQVTLFTIFRWPPPNQNGSTVSVPVTGFAEFYITGWTEQGNGNSSFDPCGDVWPGRNPGDVVGHFLNGDAVPGQSTSGNQPCDFASPTPCLGGLVE
jgi:hypothetical protein